MNRAVLASVRRPGFFKTMNRFQQNESGAPTGPLLESPYTLPAASAGEHATGSAGNEVLSEEQGDGPPEPAPADPDELPDWAYDPHDFDDLGGLCL